MVIRTPAGSIADNTLAADVKSAQELRARFRSDQRAGIRAAAQEFEALFLQMVMKSMRETMSQDSLMDSDASRFFTGMFDEQVAKDLSRTGRVGLAQMLEAQLSRNLDAAPAASSGKAASISASMRNLPVESAKTPDVEVMLERLQAEMLASRLVNQPADSRAAVSGVAIEATAATATTGERAFQNPRDFAEKLWPHAVAAGRNTGIPPQFLIAHAALETGWGKREILNADGSPSYNLFGIKAGERWQGRVAEATTTEYKNGVAAKEKARFRAYASYAESFADYARLLRDNPRYSGVIGSQNGTEFARRLQQAGYATDPEYAGKLAGIINGATLKQALIG
jgi:flagellar protein FlgJ